MNTDYNLYKIFLTLYEQKSISKTASLLYVSQPAVSYNLKELESQLGYTLFYRNSKGIEPTMEANELYSYISTAFSIMKDGEEHLKNLSSLNTGTIRIGTPSHIGVFYLSKYIASFKNQYPGINFVIISKSINSMLSMLETRKLDFIIDVAPIISAKSSIKKIPLEKLQNCFAYNKDSFPDIKIEDLKDLTNYPLILPCDSIISRQRLDEFMSDKGIVLNPVMESWTTEMVLEMVRRGIGIGYFIKNVIDIQNDKDKFEVLTFNGNLPQVDICALYIDEFIPESGKKFISTLVEKDGESK